MHPQILGKGRVAFNENFVGGKGFFKSPPAPPPLNYCPPIILGTNHSSLLTHLTPLTHLT
jgi:hypothetical protein